MNKITKFYYRKLLFAIKEIDIDYEKGIQMIDLFDIFRNIAYSMTLDVFGESAIDQITFIEEKDKELENLIAKYYEL